jgi:uncharacterized protein YegJ (DUF2314 family)
MVKFPFTDGPRGDEHPELEQMWIGDFDFDGINIAGSLLNSPNWLTSVKQGDSITMPFSKSTDWMMTSGGKAYGGFTVNLMRSRMGGRERKEHDEAWGLDFGDPNEIKIELKQKSGKGSLASRWFGNKGATPPDTEAFADHPMCVNSLSKIEGQLRENASIVTVTDERGWTLLQSESLAGNFGVVKLLVQYGADLAATTPDGRTALELARRIGWEDIAKYLEGVRQ